MRRIAKLVGKPVTIDKKVGTLIVHHRERGIYDFAFRDDGSIYVRRLAARHLRGQGNHEFLVRQEKEWQVGYGRTDDQKYDAALRDVGL